MPGNDGVVADTSPLLNLALIGRLDLFRSQFDSIIITETVREELLAGEDAQEPLETFIDSDIVGVEQPTRDDLVREFRSRLDAGESTAIALAIERDASLVLIDERDGRQVARRHELPVTGIIGVLLRAADQGRIDIESELDSLRQVGFWIGEDLYDRAIDAVENDG
jgi:predicted nucleic acid-binding protein